MSKDVQVGDKVIRELEIKLFVTSMLLQELLDETVGETRFKHKLKYHIGGLQNELDKLLSVNLNDDTLSLFITDAGNALENSIEARLGSTTG